MVSPRFLAGEPLAAAKLQQLAVADTYTPAIVSSGTNPTMGTSPTEAGFIWVSGQKVDVWVTLAFGSGMTPGSGNWAIDLPSSYPVASGWYDVSAGTARLLDSSAADEWPGGCVLDTVNNRVWVRRSSDRLLVGASNPWVWDAGDAIHLHVSYLIDAA